MAVIAILIFCRCKTIHWAEECANRYPIKSDTMTTQTVTLRNDTVYVEKTVKIPEFIKIVCPPNTDTVVITKQIVVDCPTQIVKEKTIFRHDSIFIRTVDRAKEMDLTEKLIESNSSGAITLRWKNIFMGISIAQFLLLALFIWFLFKLNKQFQPD